MGGDTIAAKLEAVILKDWPFGPNEEVMLYWIDSPYWKEKKCMVDAYFKSDKEIKRLTLDWASVHLLACGRYYKNGDLNNSRTKDESYEDIEIENTDFKIIEDSIRIGEEHVKTKIFVGHQKGIEYRIPAVEVIRSTIANNQFLLNRIVEMDTLANYFVYEYDSYRNLHIDFFHEYPKTLVSKNAYTKQLVWIISNAKVLRMFNQIGKNLKIYGELKYDFLFEKFHARARVGRRKKTDVVRILEIVELRDTGRESKIKEIFIKSPYIKEARRSLEYKIRAFEKIRSVGDRKLDSQLDGADASQPDPIMSQGTKHMHLKNVNIKKIKTGIDLVREEEDENTKLYLLENKRARTTADTGGRDTARGLEYEDIESEDFQGELEEFKEILKLLREKEDIVYVKGKIYHLQEGRKGKKFSKLSDGKTQRRYARGEIMMNDGRQVRLIEVEREGKSLSMLLLHSKGNVDWENICKAVTTGLVNKSGTWDSKMLKEIELSGVYSKRLRHLSERAKAIDKSDYIHEKMQVSVSLYY